MNLAPAAAATEIRHRRESILTLPFVRDERASLPRPLRKPLAPEASLAGVPAVLRDRVGKNVVSTAFPYAQSLRTDGVHVSTEIEVVELENARWLVVICPSLGGRVLRVYDRTAQRELLLQPPMLHQGVVGLAGAWFIGGAEFNAFRWGHNIHGSSTIETRRVRLRDGTPAVEFGACDELFGCTWQVRFALGAAQVFFRIELTNHSGEPQPNYWWTNLAVPAHRRTRVMGAPGPVLHHGMFRVGYQHDAWPILHGRDWSRWPEQHEIASAYLYENRSDFFGYLDERDGFAFVHQADRAICRGRKLWSIGAGRGDIFSERLLENAATSYMELQSGLNPMQVEAGLLPPGERRAWTESLGAITLTSAGDDERYADLFARYEHAASAAMRAEYVARQSDAAWAVQESEVIVAAEPRVALSSRIVLASETVTAAEVAQTVARGWVGGAAWRKKLATLPLDDAGRLALGAAHLDAGDMAAAEVLLRPLAAKNSEFGEWAAYLLGLKPEPATQLTPDGRRAADAMAAHARGEWAHARELMAAPFITIPEGAPTIWSCWRETFVAEAFARERAGELDAAAALLFRGGQPAPQFGMGRDEAGWGGDLLYYRWRLATKRGRTLEAALLVEQATQLDLYAGSDAAAYVARLASEAKHASAAARLAALQAWDRETGEGQRGFTPLRAIVVDALTTGRRDGWRALLAHPIYARRADFELSLAAT